MFESVGLAEILILVVAGLFILGPERLPAAAAWLGRNVRKVRDFASGARQQLKDEMGDDYEELRKPIEELQRLRGIDPRRAMAKHLFEDIDLDKAAKPNGHAPPPNPARPNESASSTPANSEKASDKASDKADEPAVEKAAEKAVEKAPFDPDAT